MIKISTKRIHQENTVFPQLLVELEKHDFGICYYDTFQRIMCEMKFDVLSNYLIMVHE